MWDVYFTAPRRAIPPGEQHVHTALEAVPFCVAAVAISTHWEEFVTLLGRGTPDFGLRLRRPPEGWKTVAAVFAAMTVLGAIPYAEELWRCRKAQLQGREGSETPECARQLFG